MAEQIIQIDGDEATQQQQSDLTKIKTDVTATVTAVDEEMDKVVHYSGWKEGDPEIDDPKDPRPEYRGLITIEIAPAGLVSFVKLKEFEKFYSYIIHEKRDEIKHCFFDKGRFWNRRWDLFYVYPPKDIQTRAIILLPVDQARHFLRAINRHLDTSIDLPSRAEAPGLIMYSPDNVPHKGEERPRWIAAVDDSETARSAISGPPGRGFPSARDTYNEYEEPTEEDLADFRAQMEALALTDREKKERDRAKREVQRHIMQKSKVREILRTQRYLGFRKRRNDVSEDAQVGNAPSARDEESQSELDLDKPTPYPQEGNVIFVCIDIEAYEYPPNQITEVGIATLDTADIVGVAPLINGRKWYGKIRAKHFLVVESMHLQNKDFCQGNRDGFVFGNTEVVQYKDLRAKILQCFMPPYSRDDAQIFSNPDDPEASRKIVFVGHDAKQDLDYLKKLDVGLSKLDNIKDVIDSANMYQALRRAENKTSLGNALLGLGLYGCNLHNGGNDAVFTLQAMIATAIKAETDKDELEDEHEAELEKRIQEAKGRQTELLMKQKEGWDLDVDSDGGEVEDAFAAFKPKAATQQAPKPKIMDPVKGLWTGYLARNVPDARATNAGPAIAHSPAEPRGNIMALNTWRPGIQNMADEDIV